MPDMPILMKGQSFIRPPHNVFYISGRYQNNNGTTHPSDRWRNVSCDNLRENGWKVTHWCYIDDLEKSMAV